VRVHVHVYGAGDQTQGFAHARQAVCHWATSLAKSLDFI
jgi:hypothetical protein